MAAAAFVLLSAVGGGWGGGFGHVVGESAASSSGEALWRIKDELGLSGPLVSFPDPGGFFLCPSLGSVDVGACFSGGGLWRFGYHLGRSGRCVDPSFSGWCLDPTFSGGLYPLLGVLFIGVLELVLCEASDSFYTGEVMAVGHLARPALSTTSRHVGFSGVLLRGPFQNFEAASLGWWSASGHLLRPPVSRTTGRFLQGLVCNFSFFEGCLCKMYGANYL